MMLESNPKLLLHHDGKKYDEGGNFVERVPVMVSGFPGGEDHLLEVPTVPDGRAKTIAKEAHQVASTSGALPYVVGEVTDSTKAMSGKHVGTLVEFDKLDGIARFHNFCRNHIGDLFQKWSYTICFQATKSPANSDFKQF